VSELAPPYLERLSAARRKMAEQGVGALALSIGAELPWLVGYEAMPLERLTLLVVRGDAEPVLLVPRLEAPRVRERPELFRLRPWEEHEDPYALAASELKGSGVIAISDRAWASALLALQRAISQAGDASVRFVSAGALLSPLRSQKDPWELSRLAGAAKAADAVASALVGGAVRLVGRTERAVSREIGERLLAEGHRRVGFAIVASGENSASPHHEPTDRTICPGEPVVCDFGGPWSPDDEPGYCSDITRTLWVGEQVDPYFATCYAVLQEAQATGVAAARPGQPAEVVDAEVRARLASAGLGEAFVHRLGHGIGLDEHEEPYLVAGARSPLLERQVFSVEPGFYLPGRFGARIEDIVVAEAGGGRALNRAPRGLALVD